MERPNEDEDEDDDDDEDENENGPGLGVGCVQSWSHPLVYRTVPTPNIFILKMSPGSGMRVFFVHPGSEWLLKKFIVYFCVKILNFTNCFQYPIFEILCLKKLVREQYLPIYLKFT